MGQLSCLWPFKCVGRLARECCLGAKWVAPSIQWCIYCIRVQYEGYEFNAERPMRTLYVKERVGERVARAAAEAGVVLRARGLNEQRVVEQRVRAVQRQERCILAEERGGRVRRVHKALEGQVPAARNPLHNHVAGARVRAAYEEEARE